MNEGSFNARRGRWGQDRRLEFIDSRLYWDGRVNRSSLTDFFGISVPQASADLAEYQARAPGNVSYDRSERTYVTTPDFKPILVDSTSGRYLAELYALTTGTIPPDISFVGKGPLTAIVKHPTRLVPAELLRAVLRAIDIGEGLDITYQSMSRPEPSRRVVSPRALSYDGFRWHLRAFCHKREEFADFVFARVLEHRVAAAPTAVPEIDEEWERFLTVEIGPHPGLSPGQRKAIELDYGMVDGRLEIRTRQCLAYYLLRRLGLHRSTDALPPNEQQVALLNRQDLTPFLPYI
ncbi:WYL domain-containing protein [Luteimonas fraxinea]|uniref:WYL domain-containing protein n=1 Tax=Luteimonas fraxinea TaxID=2901869 RepID=UPI001E555772|nr:WYL domain-containing protein [Luteimonas fraxinea]MCD9126017.1 WYL domain-containing protein [Luteimonas fraxinea]